LFDDGYIWKQCPKVFKAQLPLTAFAVEELATVRLTNYTHWLAAITSLSSGVIHKSQSRQARPAIIGTTGISDQEHDLLKAKILKRDNP